MTTMDPKHPPHLRPVPDAATPLTSPPSPAPAGYATAATLDLVKRTLLARMHEDKQASVARDAAISAKLDRLVDAVEAIRTRPDPTLAIGHELDTKIKRLADLVGQPPGSFDPRSSHVGQWTAAELADNEKNGTGIFRLVAQLASADRSILAKVAERAGAVAGTRSAIVTSAVSTAPAWMPLVWDVAQHSPAAAIGVALALVAAVGVAFVKSRLLKKGLTNE
jgi:hypothetical protein